LIAYQLNKLKKKEEKPIFIKNKIK